jgi:HK97 family phage prohead protease
MTDETVAAALPRKNLYRACFPAVEMRGDFGTETPPILAGHFSVFNQPTEINSMREGNFMETIAPGAFTKSFRDEHRGQIKALFQHGRDPQVGDKPLGTIQDLREDDIGAYYEVEMFDTSYNRDLLPGLRAGVYGASFRFQVNRESVNKNPGESAANPRGIPERVVREAHVMEMGPVTWGAYANATAGIRSLTDTIHDVDALAYAGAIILDDERMNQSRIFVSRGITEDAPAEADDARRETADRLRVVIAEARAMTDAEPAVMLDGDTCEALGSLIEVCESALEAMESLMGIDDDTGPDADDQMQMNSAPMDTLESAAQDAPPDGAATSLSHPIHGRSGSEHVTPSDAPLYGTRKDEPSWLLQ